MSLATAHPALAAEWHPTRNGDLLPEMVTPSSGKKRWWLGPCGHEWEALVSNRSRIGVGCPFCSNTRVLAGFNDLASTHPMLAAEWHPSLNAPLAPSDVFAGRGKKVWWLGRCGHEWEATPTERAYANSGCPYCRAHRVLPGFNDLATMNPALAEEWHRDRNGSLTPQAVMPFASRKVWWLGRCGHEWLASIARRSAGTGCPVCAGRQVLPGFNDIVSTHPRVGAEWHPSKNGDLSAVGVTAGCNKKVWWKCVLGHEWQATVSHRATTGTGCPYCSNKLVLAGFNDLVTTHPALAAEWHPTRNGMLAPEQTTAAAKRRVWWLGKCGHEWESFIYSRKANAGEGTGCPRCFESRGERAVTNVLEKHGIHFKAQWTHPTLRMSRRLRVDFALPTLRVLIEFDGEQHRRPVAFGGMSHEKAQRAHEETRARDAVKDRWAADNGWTMIRLTNPDTVERELAGARVIGGEPTGPCRTPGLT